MFIPDWQMDLDRALPLSTDKLFQDSIGFIEIGIVAVHLVDHKKAWHLEIIRITPGQLCTDLHPRHGVH